MTKRLRHFFDVIALTGAALLLCIVLAAPAQAQNNSARVHLETETVQVGEGQVEQVNIILENAKDVYGIDLRAEFDPQVIEIADAEPDSTGVQLLKGSFVKPDFAVRNEADNTKGTLQYVVTQVNPTPAANGSGIVLSFLVRGIKRGASSTFNINFIQIANRRGVKLPITAEDGTIEVVAPKPPTATPEVTRTREPTSVLTVPSTRAASVATRARPTSIPATTKNTTNTDLVTYVLLGGVAVAGCVGALFVLGVGGFLLMRKPRANKFF